MMPMKTSPDDFKDVKLNNYSKSKSFKSTLCCGDFTEQTNVLQLILYHKKTITGVIHSFPTTVKVKLEVQSNNILLGIKRGLSNYSLSYRGIQMAFQCNSPDP